MNTIKSPDIIPETTDLPSIHETDSVLTFESTDTSVLPSYSVEDVLPSLPPVEVIDARDKPAAPWRRRVAAAATGAIAILGVNAGLSGEAVAETSHGINILSAAAQANKCSDDNGGVEIIGHRGTGDGMYNGKAEDTIESALTAIRAGVDEVENDIQQTKDHVPVMHHDSTWNRMTNWTGPIRNTASSVLKKIRNTGGAKVATLNDYLKTVARTCADVMLENKRGLSDDVLRQEVNMVAKYFGDEPSRVTFSASEQPTLKKLKDLSLELGMDIKTALVMRGKHQWKQPQNLNQEAVDILNVDESVLNSARVNKAHALGFLVSGRRVNTLASFFRLKKLGADRAVVDINAMPEDDRSKLLRLQ